MVSHTCLVHTLYEVSVERPQINVINVYYNIQYTSYNRTIQTQSQAFYIGDKTTSSEVLVYSYLGRSCSLTPHSMF